MGNSVGKFEEFSRDCIKYSEIPFVKIELSEEKRDESMMYIFNQMELLLADMERVVIEDF